MHHTIEVSQDLRRPHTMLASEARVSGLLIACEHSVSVVIEATPCWQPIMQNEGNIARLPRTVIQHHMHWLPRMHVICSILSL